MHFFMVVEPPKKHEFQRLKIDIKVGSTIVPSHHGEKCWFYTWKDRHAGDSFRNTSNVVIR
jgi:hypothetical protein